MANLPILKAVMAGTAILMIATGVTSTVLALISVYNADRASSYGINSPSSWYARAVAKGTEYGDLYSITVAGVVAAVFGIWAAAIVCSQANHSRTYTVNLVLDVAVAIVSLEALLYSFIATYTSDATPNGPFPDDELGFIGDNRNREYSLEAWTCGVKHLGRLSTHSAFVDMCTRTRATRWLMLPLFILSVTFAILSMIWRKQHKVKVPPGPEQTKGSIELQDAAK